MSAVLRLSWTYFTATPLLRAIALLGVGLVAAGTLGYATTPVWTLGTGMRQESLLYQAFVLGLPWLGLMLLIAATAHMPGIVERIARGRSVWVLPGGRWRLLVSAVLPALLLALLTATAATFAFLAFRLEVTYATIFYRTLLMAFVDFGLIYLGIWLAAKTSGVWRLVGLFWVLVSITIPVRYLNGIPAFSLLEGLGLTVWLVFCGTVLSGGRVRSLLRGLRARLQLPAKRLAPTLAYTAGHELELMLGTTRPWVVALGQVVALALMLRFIPPFSQFEVLGLTVWLAFLTVFSAIAGAITSQAAARSRRLWLRFDWTRGDLWRSVEAAFWRYNVRLLLVLLLVYLGLAGYYRFEPLVIALGLTLLVLGCTVSTYLGFMITRGLGWFESILCILTMTTLSWTAIAIAKGVFVLALEFEILLGALTITYYVLARSRWAALDWMQCRPDAATRSAA